MQSGSGLLRRAEKTVVSHALFIITQKNSPRKPFFQKIFALRDFFDGESALSLFTPNFSEIM